MEDENQVIEVKFNTGDKYIGRFKNEQFHGEGEYYFADGNKYVGNFNFGQFYGKGVYYDNSNGTIIEANFKDNQPTNPMRILSTSEGYEYYGDIVNSVKDGKGIFKYPKQSGNAPSIYEGDFKNDKFHGKGKLNWNDGGVYEGDFFEGEITGKGDYSDHECHYEGEMLNGKKHGTGKILYKISQESYQGSFKHDKKEGHGVYKFKDQSVYEGQFVDDKKQGKGELKFANGMKYEGLFKDGVFNGKGIVEMKEGLFECNFKENAANGEGLIEFKNNEKLVAQYKDNMKMGPVTFYTEHKGKTQVYKGEFSYNVENIEKADFGSRL